MRAGQLCFMPGVPHHHKDDVGCTGNPFAPNNVYVIKGYLGNISGENPYECSIRLINRRHLKTLRFYQFLYCIETLNFVSKFKLAKPIVDLISQS
jgi:hypothetical protein